MKCSAAQLNHTFGRNNSAGTSSRNLGKTLLADSVCTELCKNIPVRFREWLAEILRCSEFFGWAADHFRVILRT